MTASIWLSIALYDLSNDALTTSGDIVVAVGVWSDSICVVGVVGYSAISAFRSVATSSLASLICYFYCSMCCLMWSDISYFVVGSSALLKSNATAVACIFGARP